MASLALAIGGCRNEVSSEQEAEPETVITEPVPEETAPAESSEVPAITVLNRTDILAAFARAIDATAAGQSLPDLNRQLVSRTFTLKLPFGCTGQASKEHPAWAGWTFEPKRQALKVFAAPERWTDADWAKSIAGDLVHEAIEGFWIERAWTSSEDCPVGKAVTKADDNASKDRQTIGIAQFFAPDSPRTFQRGSRAYSHTIRVPKLTQTEGRTFRLTLSGRVTGFRDGQPIHCVQGSPDRRPVCLIAVELARVAFEDPRDGSILAEWHN